MAVFVDGCQWHGCPDHYVRPRTREDFWSVKLAGSVARDIRQTAVLESEGWRVVRVWEHDVRAAVGVVVSQVMGALRGEPPPDARDLRVSRVEVVDPAIDLERRHLVDLRGQQPPFFEERVRWTGKRGRPPAPGSP